MSEAVLKLDPRLSEFDSDKDAASYHEWFSEKVSAARQSSTVSHDEALAHFSKKRAERLERLNADS
jgi:hypothetical protein